MSRHISEESEVPLDSTFNIPGIIEGIQNRCHLSRFHPSCCQIQHPGAVFFFQVSPRRWSPAVSVMVQMCFTDSWVVLLLLGVSFQSIIHSIRYTLPSSIWVTGFISSTVPRFVVPFAKTADPWGATWQNRNNKSCDCGTWVWAMNILSEPWKAYI